jgi:YcxB-like protein
MTSSYFTYDKPKVLQALRYHFISRREIKLMMILVNVFAIVSVTLYFLRKISPYAFITASFLWFTLMISFWFILPGIIYRRAATFKDKLRVDFESEQMTISNKRGSRSWPWTAFSTMVESPYFFHLYFDSRSFFIVPKDAFEVDQISDVRKFLRKKIPK